MGFASGGINMVSARNPNSAPISEWAKKGIDIVITSKPRTYRAILDDLFVLKTVEHRINKINGRANRRPTRSYDMPTSSQIIWYLGRNYSKVYLSDRTNKPVKTNNNATLHYFKEE
tara:strand:- start:818 stop:1165 length:348 start_codon:yes stop_codon:yes gene_type:complete